MLTWPHEGTDWSDRLQSVYPVFAEIAVAIAARETLLSVCCSHEHLATVRALLGHQGARTDHLRFCIAQSNDSWARDFGPLTTLVDGRPLLNDFRFNGWGGKFDSKLDSALSKQLHTRKVFRDTPMQMRELVLEGGAIETDGAGTLLATRSSVTAAGRNPGCSEPVIEKQLKAWLGLERFLWLDRGAIDGDDTDGHIDTLARFADPATILHATAPKGDCDYKELAAMARQLGEFRTVDGRRYDLRPLPFPGVHRDADGRRLPASYANFLLVNRAVLLPVYRVPQDKEAETVLQKAFPGHAVVAIDCSRIIEQNGSLHCLTMQFPEQIELHDGLEMAPHEEIPDQGRPASTSASG